MKNNSLICLLGVFMISFFSSFFWNSMPKSSQMAFKITDHIDGSPLNNRRCNLRDGTKLNPLNYPKRLDNASGVTGVSFSESKNAWIVQWPEGGKRRWKTFGIIDEVRTDKQAKQLAIDFRKEKDNNLGLHEQQRINE